VAAAEHRLAAEVRECAALQARLKSADEQAQQDRATWQAQHAKLQAVADLQGSRADQLQTTLLQQASSGNAESTAALLALQRTVGALEAALEAEKGGRRDDAAGKERQLEEEGMRSRRMREEADEARRGAAAAQADAQQAAARLEVGR
jgi:hypothetical protein